MSFKVTAAAAAVVAGLSLATAHEVNAGAHAGAYGGGSFWTGAPHVNMGNMGGGGVPHAYHGPTGGPMIMHNPNVGGTNGMVAPNRGRHLVNPGVYKNFDGPKVTKSLHPQQWSKKWDHDGNKGHHHHHRHVIFPLQLYNWDYGDYGYYSYGGCSWLWQRWLATGNPVWRDRYYDCID